MADDSRGPSSLTLWLEEALAGWILPVAAIAVVVATGALYAAGLVSEVTTAALLAVAAPLAVTVVMLRPALEGGRDAGSRALLIVAAALTLLVTMVPALQAILPGDALFGGDVGIEGETIAVPPGVDGRIRLLVAGRLREGGEPSATFVFTGTRQPIEGKLERTTSYARVGRLGRTPVTHDHTSDWYEGVLSPGTSALRLDRLQGHLGGRLQISVYRDWLPHGLQVVVALLVLLLAALADARAGIQGNAAVLSGMTLAFGLLVSFNATPAAAVGPAAGGVILGAVIGALAGAVAGWLGRKLVPAARKRPGGKGERRPNGAAAA